MIIEENQLRPPSPKEMADRVVFLETIVFNYDLLRSQAYGWPVNEISVLSLIEFCKQWGIPYEAKLLPGYDQDLVLDWTHIIQCEGCGQWMDTTTEHPTEPTSLHGYIIRGRELLTKKVQERDKGKLS